MTAIITLPQDVKPGDEIKFFNKVLKYNKDLLGEENLMFTFIDNRKNLSTRVVDRYLKKYNLWLLSLAEQGP